MKISDLMHVTLDQPGLIWFRDFRVYYCFNFRNESSPVQILYAFGAHLLVPLIFIRILYVLIDFSLIFIFFNLHSLGFISIDLGFIHEQKSFVN